MVKIEIVGIFLAVILFLLISNLSDPNVRSATVYGSLFGLMALGLTLTYITTKVPNFAYGSFVTIGMYTSYTLYRLNYKVLGSTMTPYLSAPIAFLIGALVSVTMYLVVLRSLARRGSSLVALMIATLAIDIGFVGIFGIFSDYLFNVYRLNDSKSFPQLFNADFSILGVPGIVFAAPLLLAVLSIALLALLTWTKLGVAMRAAVENPKLAQVLGINVELMYVIAWFLAGGFAASSGSYYILSQRGSVDEGSNLIVGIFAASVLGGLASIYGAILGGVIIGASEILITTYLAQTKIQVTSQFLTIPVSFSIGGSEVIGYQKGVPLLIMIATLLLFPRGLVSIDPRNIIRLLWNLPTRMQSRGRRIWRLSSRIIVRFFHR
ncbi:MAG TPA: branched-chain amino acid ABC transporter permease [Candidatus Bathyarchaeia archaeon]|nr:branched-chain amino acid ABC transporter permease [Candidatus Bathyarchaeia archaeon]